MTFKLILKQPVAEKLEPMFDSVNILFSSFLSILLVNEDLIKILRHKLILCVHASVDILSKNVNTISINETKIKAKKSN